MKNFNIGGKGKTPDDKAPAPGASGAKEPITTPADLAKSRLAGKPKKEAAAEKPKKERPVKEKKVKSENPPGIGEKSSGSKRRTALLALLLLVVLGGAATFYMNSMNSNKSDFVMNPNAGAPGMRVPTGVRKPAPGAPGIPPIQVKGAPAPAAAQKVNPQANPAAKSQPKAPERIAAQRTPNLLPPDELKKLPEEKKPATPAKVQKNQPTATMPPKPVVAGKPLTQQEQIAMRNKMLAMKHKQEAAAKAAPVVPVKKEKPVIVAKNEAIRKKTKINKPQRMPVAVNRAPEPIRTRTPNRAVSKPVGTTRERVVSTKKATARKTRRVSPSETYGRGEKIARQSPRSNMIYIVDPSLRSKSARRAAIYGDTYRPVTPPSNSVNIKKFPDGSIESTSKIDFYSWPGGRSEGNSKTLFDSEPDFGNRNRDGAAEELNAVKKFYMVLVKQSQDPEELRQIGRKMGLDSLSPEIKETTQNGQPTYWLTVGHYTSPDKASNKASELRSLGYKTTVVSEKVYY